MRRWYLSLGLIGLLSSCIIAYAANVQKTAEEIEAVIQNSDDPQRTEETYRDLESLGLIEIVASPRPSPTPTNTFAPKCKGGEYTCIRNGGCVQYGCTVCSANKCY